MNVSPENSGTIRLEGESGEVKEPTVYPTPDADAIDCFDRNEMVTITANPKTGYKFDYWEFNYWPLDLNERIDKTSDSLTFENSYLANDDNDGDGYTEAIGDCDDSNASIHPDAEEICGDGIDQDCNGSDLSCDGDIVDDEYTYTVDYNTIRAITAHFTLSSNPPEAPENIIATDGTETGKIIITWDNSNGATSYEVFRADSYSGNKTKIGTPSATAYEDTTVFQDNTYYYWIRASNQYGPSSYSSYDTGYAYVDEQEPPSPVYEPEAISPLDAKEMLDTDPDVIVLDVSDSNKYEANHILCAINGIITVFDTLDNKSYMMLNDYMDFPVLVYDQDGSASQMAADYLAGKKGFSEVYYMTDGLLQWMANGWETVDSDQLYECSLPPMALAGQDTPVDENEPVTLDGAGSQAPDNKALTYEWRQYQGTEVDIENAASVQAGFISPYVQEGGEKLIFFLTVTDSQNNQDTDSVAVDVVWHNSPPVADAGSFQSVPEGTTVILDGSESSDRDDGIIAYQWERISGPDAELQNSTSETARFTAPDIDTDDAELVFELTVTDKGGLSDKNRVSIIVTRNNVPPMADAGPNQTVSETQQVQLDGSGSYDDEDDENVTYAWTQTGDGPTVQLSSLSNVKPTFTAPEVDTGSITLEFQLTVSDSNGGQSTDQVAITIDDAGDPPQADAGTDQNPVYEGWQITLDGTGSKDADGEILSYHWTQTSGPEVSLTGENSATPEFTVPKLDEQSVQLVFQVMVTDDTSLNGTDQVKIVATKALMPPSADAGNDQEIKEGQMVILDGSGSSDPDDGISSYFWRQTGGEPAVELSDSTAVNPEFTAPDVDKETVLRFELTTNDFSENQDTDEVQIQILPDGGSDSSCFISTLNL